MKTAGMYGSGDDYTVVNDNKEKEPRVVDVKALKELPDYPTIVTTIMYFYENGMKETLSLERDDSLIVTAFSIEIENPTIVNEEMEEETDVSKNQFIYCQILRDENGNFDGLHFEYSEGV